MINCAYEDTPQIACLQPTYYSVIEIVLGGHSICAMSATAPFLLTLLFSLLYSAVCSQTDTTLVKIYYPIDVYELNPKQKNTLRQSINATTAIELELHIKSSADHLGSQEYNLKLSTRRAQEIQSVIQQQFPNRSFTTRVVALGEVQDQIQSKEGNQKNRATSILIIEKRKPKSKKKPIVKEIQKDVRVDVRKIPKDKIPASTPLSREDFFNGTFTKGGLVEIDDLIFWGGRNKLLPKSRPIIQQLIDLLKENPTVLIEIRGHICCQPADIPDGYNSDTRTQTLSHDRAQAVFSLLARGGVHPSRMMFKGYGASQKKVKNERTEQDRSANRRVEIKILDF